MARAAQGMLAAMVVLLLAFSVRAGAELTIQALVQNPSRYDGKVVTVVGTITTYREYASDSGHPYTVFRLADGDASLSVFIWNKHRFGKGDRVRVTGTFARARSVGAVPFDNEIQAHRIEAMP